MPSLYFKPPPRNLSPSEMELATARYRKALADGIPYKHLVKSGRFKHILPDRMMQQISVEERRSRKKRSGIRGKGAHG